MKTSYRVILRGVRDEGKVAGVLSEWNADNGHPLSVCPRTHRLLRHGLAMSESDFDSLIHCVLDIVDLAGNPVEYHGAGMRQLFHNPQSWVAGG
jgi:hypothetical protein